MLHSQCSLKLLLRNEEPHPIVTKGNGIRRMCDMCDTRTTNNRHQTCRTTSRTETVTTPPSPSLTARAKARPEKKTLWASAGVPAKTRTWRHKHPLTHCQYPLMWDGNHQKRRKPGPHGLQDNNVNANTRMLPMMRCQTT